MSIGQLTAGNFVSNITVQDADNGISYYTTVENDEIIKPLEWHTEHSTEPQFTNMRLNSITIEAIDDDLYVFPIRQLTSRPQFGLYVAVGSPVKIEGIEFIGFMVRGSAGQTLRFYGDTF